VAMTFSFPTPDGSASLMDISRLDTLVTVVDASAWLADYREGQRLKTLGMAVNDQDTRTLSDLLIDQVEFANVIVMNKTDVALPDELDELEALLRKLNPSAKLIRAQQGKVSPRDILNTGMFDMDKAQQSAGWLHELQNEHTPETEAYGIRSFAFRARRPFHPQRLMAVLKSSPMNKVLRSKGFFWLASRFNDGINWSVAGHIARVSPAGTWLAADAQFTAQTDDERDYVAQYWQEPYGDRRQELVFIGIGLDVPSMQAAFAAALLTDDELARGAAAWRTYDDPFPKWQPNGVLA
jgi:G3E family GTPase